MPTRVDPGTHGVASSAVTIHISAEGANSATCLPGYVELNPLRDEFNELADRWYGDTGHLSSPRQIAVHPAYQSIIGMGWRVIPLILESLKERGGQWYWALRAITKQTPVSDEDVGDIRRMKEAWLRWGAARGYIAN